MNDCEMKELILILRGMNRPENKDSLVNYGELNRLITLLLQSLAPKCWNRAQDKLNTE